MAVSGKHCLPGEASPQSQQSKKKILAPPNSIWFPKLLFFKQPKKILPAEEYCRQKKRF